MRQHFSLIFMLVFLCGCAGSQYATWKLANALEEVRSDNRSNLMKLEIGMSKPDALAIMGVDEKKLWGGIGYSQRISNPYRSEILDSNAGPMEVLYYYTDLKKQDGAITADELTPLVFKEAKLIGWGQSFLDESVEKYEIRIR